MKMMLSVSSGPFWVVMDPRDGRWFYDENGQLMAFNTKQQAIDHSADNDAVVSVGSLTAEFKDEIEIVVND